MGGALFGARFELQKLLGSGGMARVHRARDTRLGRIVALKTLHPELARDPEARSRFAREARAAAALNHPGIVTVHDQNEVHDEDGIVPYLVMEYIDGSTLEDIAKTEVPMDVERAVRITCDVLDALAHAHSRGTVHRDVKPSNVMITKSGAVKVADFGIARVADSVSTRLTGTGFTVGTPGYMAPEQVLGRHVDARSDLYAVGCMLTELLTGEVPFTGNSALNVMYLHVHQAPPSLSERNPRVPRELEAVVLAALAKDPQERPVDAVTMRGSLREWLAGRPEAGRPQAGRADAERVALDKGAGGGAVGGNAVGGGAIDVQAAGGAAAEGAPGSGAAGSGASGSGASGSGASAAGSAASGSSATGGYAVGGADASGAAGSGADASGAAGSGADASGAAGSGAVGSGGSGTPDPRTMFLFVKEGGPAAVSAAGAAAAAAGAAGPLPPHSSPPQQIPVPPLRDPGAVHPALRDIRPGPSPLAYPPAPPQAPPSTRGARRRWMVAGAAVAVAGLLTTAALVFHPFGGSGDTKDRATNDKSHDGKTGDIVKDRRSTSGFNGALTGAVNPSKKKGGTLKIASAYPPDSLDPARSYTSMAWNLQRIYLRKLVDYAPMPGEAGTKLRPDLATSTGEVSADGKTYTFELKRGLRFEDGTTITSRDVKYGIERTFAQDVYGTGPSHLVDLLDQGQHYPGPYKDSDPQKLGLRSVTTPDDSTIVFKLKDPFPDFPYVLAMSIAAPVPKDKDTQKEYEKKPVASGPYKLQAPFTSSGAQSLRLVRNDQWDASTDPVRTALPDEIEFSFPSGGQDAVDQALLNGEVDVDAAQLGVGETAQTSIQNSDKLKARSDAAYTGGVRYFSIQTTVPPFDNVNCRRAVEYAVDKPDMRAVLGGRTAGGDIASGMLPPTIRGFDKSLDPYGTKAGPQILEAKRSLDACDKPKGFSTKLVASSANPRNREVLEVLQGNLKKVGIKADIEMISGADYYTNLGRASVVKKKKWAVALTAWSSDWPAPAGFLRPLVGKDSAYNYSGLVDWDIDGLMDDAEREKDRAKADKTWRKVDESLMWDAVMVPIIHDRQLNYRGPRLTNAYIQPALGGIDLQALGLK
ncbi:ABC transporter substrate-binding protein [Wenjunlia tyrosinilytica]|nr:ABC transporter substrate-binding protein [Wenjunlia tyrosinilytica]